MIKAVVLDVDGVLTDGTIGLTLDTGQEIKRLSFRDIMGVSLAKKAGIVFGIISGEPSWMVYRLADKLGIEWVRKGCQDKAADLRDFAKDHELHLSEVAYMGDDVNDVEAMKLAGLSVAPADAHSSAREVAKWVTRASGGHGAVRELVDYIMQGGD